MLSTIKEYEKIKEVIVPGEFRETKMVNETE